VHQTGDAIGARDYAFAMIVKNLKPSFVAAGQWRDIGLFSRGRGG
jgi:hypothetical protein